MHCQDATRAMSEAQERKLALGERASLQLHLAICRYCRDFERQVAFLRDSMQSYARRPDERDDSNASSE